MPSGAMASGLRLAGTRFLVTLLALLLLPVTCFVSNLLSVSFFYGLRCLLGGRKDLLMTIGRRSPLCSAGAGDQVLKGVAGDEVGGGGTASSRPLSAATLLQQPSHQSTNGRR